MYQPTESLDLDYTNQQLLPRRYESEEEDISESEHGGQDNGFSPVDDTTGASPNMSTEKLSDVGVDLEIENRHVARLLSPYPSRGRKSRPVSMDTIKRSSNTTFVADSIAFDEDDAIIELPSLDQPSPFESPIFLQPAVYVPPGSPVSSSARSTRSLSPTSVYSEDETDVFMAEKVTYVEPISKPSLIQISPDQSNFPAAASLSRKRNTFYQEKTSSDSTKAASEGIYSLRQAARSQPLLANREQKVDPDREKEQQLRRKSLSIGQHTSQAEEESDFMELPQPSATICSVSELPEVPQPHSPRFRSKTFSGLRTSGAEKGASLYTVMRSRLPTESLRRPPSARNMGSSSGLFSHARHASASPGNDSRKRPTGISHTRMSSELSSPLQACRSPSPVMTNNAPYYSSPTFSRNRSGSVYSNISAPTPTTYRPRPVRDSTMHSIKSSYSSSLRSEVESVHSVEAQEPVQQECISKGSRKKSLKRSKLAKQEGKEQSTAKSIMGFMLRGKRKSTIWHQRS
ncbi:uncharacterized protein ACLA_002390 [Aspergillus clavatus NRRL 1]|uniref:Uncharacterized protein n=1 Tax=Aspergillus clavatus (strain ATCC 1007 / CBS 513.65 / DSM 816 / NCTC 3887 / NRRL 1 / QM 1276 / 107) TaxID=344612 RepID=A1C560_ASPCL|nr:uncharacterized protein ACLA_002390 [Aspergillus clavatus NRRL 1]EAW14828.1 conserved hypothetical protein [Aspergillus clavatus NRRL 1]